MNELVDNCFKLINMIVLGALLLYIVYKYVLPLLKTELANDQAIIHAIALQQKTLSEEIDFLDKNIQREIYEQEILKQRIYFWNKSIDAFKVSTNILKQKRIDEMYNRKTAIKKKQLQIQIEQRIIHTAITEAEENLKHFFIPRQKG